MLEEKELKNFEIVLQTRDLVGNPTGKTKSFRTDDGNELDDWYTKNSWKPLNPKKRRDEKRRDRKDMGKTTAKEGTQILKEMLLTQEKESE